MKRSMFTPEDLAELAKFDAEVDDEPITQNEIEASMRRDKDAMFAAKDAKAKKLAEYQRAYRAANKEKFAEYQRAYYEANKEKLAEYWRAYMSDPCKREARRVRCREYMRRKRAAEKEKNA